MRAHACRVTFCQRPLRRSTACAITSPTAVDRCRYDRGAVFGSLSSIASSTLSTESLRQQRGFALLTWSHNGYTDPKTHEYIHEIINTGANWIQLTPTQYQNSENTNEVTPTSQTPSDEGLERVISLAYKHDIKVLLKPHVDVSASPGSQAKIRPGNPTHGFPPTHSSSTTTRTSQHDSTLNSSPSAPNSLAYPKTAIIG